MGHHLRTAVAALFLNAITFAPPAAAQSTNPALTYIPGSSVELYQINGDCDWVEWDATITNKTPTCKSTISKTVTNGDVLGDDVATSFENNGELIMMFGDMIGAAAYSMWTVIQKYVCVECPRPGVFRHQPNYIFRTPRILAKSRAHSLVPNFPSMMTPSVRARVRGPASVSSPNYERGELLSCARSQETRH
jgi:hypothetical protein